MPTNGDGDFTFTRSSAATRVNADGNIEKETMNLMPYSNNFSQWSPKSGTFTQGVADPFGGNNAWSLTATNADPYLYRNPSVTGVITLSIWVKGVGSSIGKDFLLVSNGSSPSTSAHTLTSEWVRYESYFNATSTNIIGFEIPNPAVAGDVVHLYGAQLEQGLVARDYIETTTSAVYGGITDNVPRLDYTDSSCPALLLEPQRTNLLTQSEYLDDSTDWNSGTNNQIEYNATTSPEGYQNATKIYSTGGNQLNRYNAFPAVTIGTTYTYTAYLKKDTSNEIDLYIYSVAQSGFVERGRINFDAGTITNIEGTSATIEDVGNDWYRAKVSFAADGTLSYGFLSPTATNSSVFVYGVQVEAGAYATSYIPTYGSSVSRVGDDFYNNGYQANNIFGTNSGSIFFDFGDDFTFFDGVSNSSPTDLFQFVDVTSYGGGYIRFRGGESSHYLQLVSMGAADNSLSFTDQTKYCICWDSNGVDFYGNGALIQSTTITNVPSFDRLERGITGNGREGRVKEMLFFTTKLSSQEAIDLTTI